MKTASIAWRNVWRRKRRSLLSMLAVAVSVALLIVMMALQQGSYADMINNTVSARCGHLQVQHPRYREQSDLLNSIDDPDSVMQALRELPHLAGMAPRVFAPVLASRGDRTFGAAVTGVDPQREAEASRLDESVVDGRWLRPDDRDAAVVGTVLAGNLGVKPGDELVFLGQGRDGSTAAARLTVVGLYELGIDTFDRSTFAAPLAAVQEAFTMDGGVTEISVLLEDDRFREAAVAAAARRLADQPDAAVLGWPEIMPGMAQVIRIDWISGLVIYTVLVLVVGFGIANTFLMAFFERIHEYGVLLSLGMRPHTLAAMAYLESLMLIGLGLVLGLMAGIPVTAWLGRRGISFFESDHIAARYGISDLLYPRLTLMGVAWAVGIVLIVAALMAVYPAIKASRLEPVEALRHA